MSADAPSAHGLAPQLAIHDELGQVRGLQSALYDALESATGALQCAGHHTQQERAENREKEKCAHGILPLFKRVQLAPNVMAGSIVSAPFQADCGGCFICFCAVTSKILGNPRDSEDLPYLSVGHSVGLDSNSDVRGLDGPRCLGDERAGVQRHRSQARSVLRARAEFEAALGERRDE